MPFKNIFFMLALFSIGFGQHTLSLLPFEGTNVSTAIILAAILNFTRICILLHLDMLWAMIIYLINNNFICS